LEMMVLVEEVCFRRDRGNAMHSSGQRASGVSAAQSNCTEAACDEHDA